ncbi:MAG: ribosome small subunit-dependent GTPase A [Candidatus Paceibacterota bacterium]
MNAKPKIEDFGYDDFFEINRKKLNLDSFSVARIITEHRSVYEAINQNGIFLAKITGKQMFRASSREDYPVIGDWVVIDELNDGQAVIRGILPRKTIIKRKFGDENRAGKKTKTQVIGANIDVVYAIESVDRDYNLNRFERYFAIARDGGVRPVIVLNKVDLISKENLNSKLSELKRRFKDVDIVTTSTVSTEGLDELRKHMVRGKTYCFLGSSGVGKSSLINKLIGEGEKIKIGDISKYSGRGKHTTTSREMYFLKSGSIVIDNPGMREVGMAIAKEGVVDLFDEITILAKKCKYINCAHVSEPGCEVLSALKSGKLDKGKYLNYTNLKKEAEYHEMTELEKREKDRQFGKFVNKAKKDLKDREHKSY